VIGKIIKKMVLVLNIIKMVINMKVDGLKIKDMDKVHFGYVMKKIN
jgi:hypothetical protein